MERVTLDLEQLSIRASKYITVVCNTIYQDIRNGTLYTHYKNNLPIRKIFYRVCKPNMSESTWDKFLQSAEFQMIDNNNTGTALSNDNFDDVVFALIEHKALEGKAW